MLTVFLRGLEFYAYHGVPAAEREIGHRYVVDLEMQVESEAETTDRVEDTVDYGRVGRDVVSLGQTAQFLTVERLAAAIAEQLLENHPRIIGLTVKVGKRMPPAPFVAEVAGVAIFRAR